jgi:CHAD domain-containing protein
LKARRDVDRLGVAPIDDADALHRLRIAYKRLRYTAETFAATLPPDIAALAQLAARFQGKLGDLHDVDVAIGCVRRARSLAPDARAALLAALERQRAARAAAYAREAGLAVLAPLARVDHAGSQRRVAGARASSKFSA